VPQYALVTGDRGAVVRRHGRGRAAAVIKNARRVASAPLSSGGHSSWLYSQRSRVRLPALPDFLSTSGSATESTHPREDK
jgi:hypothetical protein